ncbi:hypothetical protein EDD85DRAFT_794183 [Armillaria nabsnona]|nr:hypothetical protein EDD85DRAFT_794183 [Armillaria nabsnona]
MATTSSTSDPRHGPAISREEEDAEKQGSKGFEKREKESHEPEGEQEQDGVQVATPLTSANVAKAPMVAGRKRSNPAVQKENDSYDYEQKYPEDAPYEETAPAARVWRTYQDESRIHDTNMVEEFRDNVDVLLVFIPKAGLFSAVVTTFIVQTSQNLQADYAAMSASLLFELVLVQRAIASGSTVNSIAPSSLNPSIAFVPATTDVWVNGLWFTSLFLSLTTALVAVLVKQWLHHYVALPSGTPRDRSFIRTVIVYGAYSAAAVLPILYPQCPYRTPLCDLAYSTFCHTAPRLSWSFWRKDAFVEAVMRCSVSEMLRYLPRLRTRNTRSLTMIESNAMQQMSTKLAAEALDWLFSVSSNTSIQSIVIQSIGGLPMASEREFFKLKSYADRKAMADIHRTLLGNCLQPDEEYPQYDRPVPGKELKVGRLLRFDAHFNDIFVLDRFIVPDAKSSELIPTLNSSYCRSPAGRPAGFSTVDVFFKDLICAESSLKLPLLRWSHLMGCARRADIFSPLSPETDDRANTFPVALCSALINSFGKSMEYPVPDFSSPIVLRFEDAVPYIHEEVYDNVLTMLSWFILHPRLSKPLKMLVAAMKFLLYRLALPESNMSRTNICSLLITAVKQLDGEIFSSQEVSVVIMVLEDIFSTCIILEWDTPSADELCYHATSAYYHSITISPSACSLNGLKLIVGRMTANWERGDGHQWYQFDIPCRVLAHLLANHIPAAYAVFLEKQCLEIFGNHSFHGASYQVITKYVAGISALSDGEILRQHVEYLHEPRNLFTACSILAMHGFKDADQAAIRSDISTLVRLCPRDAAWDGCRRKFHDLMGNDDNEFFSDQQRFDHELQSNEFQIGKDNIRHAIDVLDALFNNGHI